MMERIFIFDTTLRDGEQSPGATMNIQEKLRVAQQLEKLRVDTIEAGFPIASEGDFEAVRAIAQAIHGSKIVGLARVNKEDIDAAWGAVKEARHPGIHIFLSTSDIHLRHQLKKSRKEVLNMTFEAVRYGKAYTDDVEFSPMDATRTDPGFLCEILQAAIDSGATTVNIPDTVGYAMPDEFAEIIKTIQRKVSNISKAIISVHCHNDLGLAVANSLSGLRAGARQVECTINGIGERAGNASMEEIVMAIKTRKDHLRLRTGINTEYLYPSSRLITHITGIPVQPNKAVVGANAFAHESGIHQDGLLKDKRTYEIIKPESIGLSQTSLVLGKHSGRHALKDRLERFGYNLTEADIDRIFESFKRIADKKKEIFDEDIEVLVAEEVFRIPDKYRLTYLNVSTGSVTVPTATVKIEINGTARQAAGFGNGPVDAVFATIRKITKTKARLLRYTVNAITVGSDAQGEVTVRLGYNGHMIIGQGTHPDILMASAMAYINALNRLEYRKRYPLMIAGGEV